MTPKELIDRVRDSVDGVEVSASERETNFALLSAGLTVAGIALDRMSGADREYQLERLEEATRAHLALLEAARQRRLSLN